MGVMVGIACCVGNKRAVATAESEPTGIMTFADPVMQALCAKTWGDGTNITYEQAREVTEIPTSFAEGNVNVKSFMEFVYFTSVTVMMTATFRNCVNFHSILLPKNLQKLTKTNFENTKIVKIILPDSVTIIGESAFYGCSALTSINIPDSVTAIGNYAFKGCKSLKEIKIPLNVNSLGSRLINDCNSLSVVSVDENNSVYDSRGNCNAIIKTSENKLLYGCKDSFIPDSVTTIGEYAFNQCSALTSINIPDSVTTIGDYAFYGCSALTSINIPDSVTTIGEHAFNQCSALKNAKLSNNQIHISSYLFNGCSNLTSVIIGAKVKNIWYQAFNSSGLEFIEIPDSVTNIYEGAFSRCKNLASVHLSNSINSIGFAGFSSGKLSNITLPDSLTKLEAKVFYNNPNLSVVKSLNRIPPTIGSDCFALTSSDLKIYVPDDSVEAYKTATNWSAYANKILPLSQFNR